MVPSSPSSSSASSDQSRWSVLPVEIQLAITQHLDIKSLLALSLVSHHNYTLCLPTVYNSVTLSSLARLQRFLDHVPADHALHIRTLDVNTAAGDRPTQVACSDALSRILALTPHLRSLSLHLSTDLSQRVVSSFSRLEQLSDLAVEPCRDEIYSSLSEPTIVGLALAIPNLKSLSISRVARALPRPVDTWRTSRSCAMADTDTDDSPYLATATLPNLLSIPSLRHLAIHNTFLENPLFSSTDLSVRCQLESLEIGAFENASPTENARWATQILQRAGSHLRSVVLGSGIINTNTTDRCLSLPSLERVRFTPIFSPSHLPSTLRTLAAAAGRCLRHIHVQCLTVDLEDVCEELSECVEHVNGGPYNLKLRVFPALKGDILAEQQQQQQQPPVTSDACCVPVPVPAHSLDENAQGALSRLANAFTSAGTPISIMGNNVVQQEDEEQDWDDLTVVDETAVGMEMKDTVVMEEPWAQVGIW